MKSQQDRAHQRFALQLAVRAQSRTRPIERVGTVSDLGLGGAALELDQPLRHAEIVDLFIQNPSADDGEAEAPSGQTPNAFHSVRVVWIAWGEGSCVRIGVAFNEEHVELAKHLLAQLNLTA